jgi:AcrR family transcriptional regulator
MSPRGDAHNARLREQATEALLDAALEAFADKGFHGASVASIATRAGTSKGLVYAYFPTKEDLLVAVVRRRLADAVALLDAVPPGPPAEQLGRFIADQLDAAAANVTSYRLLLALELQPDVAPALRRATVALAAPLTALADRLTAIFADLGAADPAAETRYFQATMTGAIHALVLSPHRFPRAAFEERLRRTFIRRRTHGPW